MAILSVSVSLSRLVVRHRQTFSMLGPNELSVNRADAVQPILGSLGMPKGPCEPTLLFLDMRVAHIICSNQRVVQPSPSGTC